MHSRGVRLALALVFLLATIAAAYVLFTTHIASRASRASLGSLDAELQAVTVSIAELRASQQAYVAAGQGEGYWISRVAERLDSLRSRLSALKARAREAETRNRIEAATAKLEDFDEMDRRAREYARGGQRLLASDLIFADGLETTRAAQAHVEAARVAERSAIDDELHALDRRQALIAGLTLAAGLLFVFVFMPVPPRATPEPGAETALSADLGRAAPLGGAAGIKAGEFRQAAPDATGMAPDAELARLDRTRGGAESLVRAADLCADLAQVQDARQLGALLGRAADVLDAAGMIVWMADPDRRELVPTLTHGYAPAALARFGTIPREADNATAAAFREGALKTVAADGPASGAIVAPLVTPGGCVGVIAAEVSGGRERDAATRAVARIVAAQLAALLGAPPAAARAHRAAEAG